MNVFYERTNSSYMGVDTIWFVIFDSIASILTIIIKYSDS